MAYVLLANSWAIFAISMNNLFSNEEPTIMQVTTCYLYNVIGFPVALWVAIYNTNVGVFDKHIKSPRQDALIAECAHKLNYANARINTLVDLVDDLEQQLDDAVDKP